jgi:hypothetical protein
MVRTENHLVLFTQTDRHVLMTFYIYDLWTAQWKLHDRGTRTQIRQSALKNLSGRYTQFASCVSLILANATKGFRIEGELQCANPSGEPLDFTMHKA